MPNKKHCAHKLGQDVDRHNELLEDRNAAAVAALLGPQAPTAVEAKSLAEGLRSALGPKGAEQDDPIEPWDSDLFKPPVFRSGLLENAKAARLAKKATQYRDLSRTPPPSKRNSRR